MSVPETMRQLRGWKYPLYVDQEFHTAPELIDTLLEHGVPRELIIFKDRRLTENFDFFANVRRFPDDYDHIVVTLYPHVEKGVNTLSFSCPRDIVSMRITSSEWFDRTNKRI